jgi:uncharacterized protein (TIGR02118 family)
VISTTRSAEDHSAPARLLVLWTRPVEPDLFEADYAGRHMPLAAALPDLTYAASSRVKSKRFHRLAELRFPNLRALSEAMSGPEGLAVSEDSKRLAEAYGVESISLIALDPDIFLPIREGHDNERR